MKTTKHSPGPWTVDRNMIETASGEVIAQVSYKQAGYVRANARLMAAAPALLEALKLFMNQYDGLGRENRPEIAAARAAIANATEQSEPEPEPPQMRLV